MLTPQNTCLGVAVLVIGVALLLWQACDFVIEYRRLDFREAVKKSKITWGLWQTGGQVIESKIFEQKEAQAIKEIMLLKPDKSSPIFNYITDLAGRTTQAKKDMQISEINTITEYVKSAKHSIELYYHLEPLTYTFTIFEPTPHKTKKSSPIPFSKNAWIVVQPLEPERIKEKTKWHKWTVKNKGSDKEQFEAYYRLFVDVRKRAEIIWPTQQV
jgi:hypothetical protein